MDPPERVRSILAYDRRMGLSFQTAWGDALDSLSSLPPDDRHNWEEALRGTRHVWAAAFRYDGEPTALDRTLLD